ncbi:hypothetical protein ACYOEI_32130, partial [Singulisphaera rosea]
MSFAKRRAGVRGSQKARNARSRLAVLAPEMLESRLVLSTFNVNSLADTVAVDLQSGKDSTGHITLRSAIMAANHSSGQDTIKLPSGTITLTLQGSNDDQGLSGDLDIDNDLKIEGQGADKSIIDGNNIDRVIDVFGGQVSLSNLTIQHGREVDKGSNGGGGLKNAGGNVTLTSVDLLGNFVVSDNGVSGKPGLNGGNGGPGTPGLASEGGAIFNDSGTLTLVDTLISSNLAIGSLGGNGGTGATNIGASGGIAQPGKSATGGSGGIGGNGG